MFEQIAANKRKSAVLVVVMALLLGALGWFGGEAFLGQGGGFTGLSAALNLAEMGMDVVLLEAERIGFGASGRCGGLVGTGQRMDVLEMEEAFGYDRSKQFWQFAEAAKDEIRMRVEKHSIDCDLQKGQLVGVHKKSYCGWPREMAEGMFRALKPGGRLTRSEGGAIAPQCLAQFPEEGLRELRAAAIRRRMETSELEVHRIVIGGDAGSHQCHVGDVGADQGTRFDEAVDPSRVEVP